MTQQFDTTVLGGLPVTIAFTTTGYDNSDVGHGVNDVDEWWIDAVNGRSTKADWVYNRLSARERDSIYEACAHNR